MFLQEVILKGVPWDRVVWGVPMVVVLQHLRKLVLTDNHLCHLHQVSSSCNRDVLPTLLFFMPCLARCWQDSWNQDDLLHPCSNFAAHVGGDVAFLPVLPQGQHP